MKSGSGLLIWGTLRSHRLCPVARADGRDANVRWFDYLQEQRTQKLREIGRLETGKVELSATSSGETRDITSEQLTNLKSDVAQIRQVFIDEGVEPGN